MARQISEERQAAFYLGTALMIIGGLLFASFFLSVVTQSGNFDSFDSDARSAAFRAFAGMALLILGGFLRKLGARGLAGSGVVLDPEQAREDLEPYSRMVGGMAKDALDEADVTLDGKPERVVTIKCPSCGTLCEENAKFCRECGKKL